MDGCACVRVCQKQKKKGCEAWKVCYKLHECVFEWLCEIERRGGERNTKQTKKMWKLKMRWGGGKKKSCYLVWPARALGINLAGVTNETFVGFDLPLALCGWAPSPRSSARGQACIIRSNLFLIALSSAEHWCFIVVFNECILWKMKIYFWVFVNKGTFTKPVFESRSLNILCWFTCME